MSGFSEMALDNISSAYTHPIEMLNALNGFFLADSLEFEKIEQLENILENMQSGNDLLDLYHQDPQQALIRIEQYFNPAKNLVELAKEIEDWEVEKIKMNLQKVSNHKL